jgi:hypothetical protein
MTICRSVRLFTIAIPLFIAITGSDASAAELAVPSEASRAQLGSDLAEKWDLQRSSVQSARLRFGFLQLMGDNAAKLTVDRLDAFFASIDSNIGQSSVLEEQTAVDAILRLNLPKQLQRLDELKVCIAGGRVKNERREIDGPKELLNQSAFDGQHYVWQFSDNKQTDVYLGRAKIWTAGIADVLFVPPKGYERILKNRVGDRTLTRLSSSRSKDHKIECVIDSDTGFVRRFWDEGRELIIQSPPISFETGVLFPAISAHVKFQNNKPHLTHMYFLLDAEFNTEVIDADFDVPVEAKSVLVDKRHGNVESFKTYQPFSSAVEAVDTIEANRRFRAAPIEQNGGSGRNWSFLVINVGIVFVLVASIIYRRMR